MYGRSEHTQNIQPYDSCYDPLSYPLFFPNGEPGWHPNIPRHGELMNEVHNHHNNINEETEGTDNLPLFLSKVHNYKITCNVINL